MRPRSPTTASDQAPPIPGRKHRPSFAELAGDQQLLRPKGSIKIPSTGAAAKQRPISASVAIPPPKPVQTRGSVDSSGIHQPPVRAVPMLQRGFSMDSKTMTSLLVRRQSSKRITAQEGCRILDKFQKPAEEDLSGTVFPSPRYNTVSINPYAAGGQF